jgi:hypothetical protein
MIPMKMPLQGLQNLLKGRRHAYDYDAEHRAILLNLLACTRCYLTLPGGLPLRPPL